MALQIVGSDCGETIIVLNDPDSSEVSDAKRIMIGPVLGTVGGATDHVEVFFRGSDGLIDWFWNDLDDTAADTVDELIARLLLL